VWQLPPAKSLEVVDTATQLVLKEISTDNDLDFTLP
jgi:hypothetical protein